MKTNEKERNGNQLMDFPLEEYLNDLETIINIDSGSTDLEGCRKVADFFCAKLKAAGFLTEIRSAGIQNRPLVVAKHPASDSITDSTSVSSSTSVPLHMSAPSEDSHYDFFLNGHLDTVFPKGTTAQRPFRKEGNLIYGPGTVDMKAGALLIVYLAHYMKATLPQVSFTIALNCDEEIGSPDSFEELRKLASCCRHIFIFEGMRKQGQFVNERKGIAKYDIQVEGIASHAGTAPRQGVSAIVELSKIIVDLSKAQNLDKGTSINVGLIDGGTALNVIAPSAHAIMEVRYTSEREFSRITRRLQKMTDRPHLEGASVSFRQISHYPPLTITPATRSLMDKLGSLGLEYVKAGGTSDANRLAGLGISILDGCGPGGGFPHSEKEFLDLTTVPQRFYRMLEIFRKLSVK